MPRENLEFTVGVLLAMLLLFVLCGEAPAQDCVGDCPATDTMQPAEPVFASLEQLKAAQEQDKATLNKMIAEWQRRLEADPQVAGLKNRLSTRAGAIQREEQLQKEGYLEEKRMRKDMEKGK